VAVSPTEAAATGERFTEILMVITASFMVNLDKMEDSYSTMFFEGLATSKVFALT